MLMRFLRERSEFQAAYDNAFEPETTPVEFFVDVHKKSEDELREKYDQLDEDVEKLYMDGLLTYLGNRARLTDDPAYEELEKEADAFVDGGFPIGGSLGESLAEWPAKLFSSYVAEGDFETASAIAGEDVETVEERFGGYHETLARRAEEYGVHTDTLKSDQEKRVPVAKGYRAAYDLLNGTGDFGPAEVPEKLQQVAEAAAVLQEQTAQRGA